MIGYYRNLAVISLLLTLSSIALIYFGYSQRQVVTGLFPNDSPLQWRSSLEPGHTDYKTRLSLRSEQGSIDYEFFLDPEHRYAYSHYSLEFVEDDVPYSMVDFTGYDGLQFRVSCDPKNVLLLALLTYDAKVTDPEDLRTRRVSSKAFSCNTQWQTVFISFEDIVTPHWWLGDHNYELSEGAYALDKVMAIAFINSLQSPRDVISNTRLSDIKLVGTDNAPFYSAVMITVFGWVLCAVYFVREYVRVLTVELRDRLLRDQSIIAYKKLTIEPQKDKEKKALMHFLATQYADPEISLESVAGALGINRTKINELLKEELGLTFSAYLNKLRLTEAARLLSACEGTSISEIAYSVGYNNVPYFNKLFKKEYGCTPKIFQNFSS